MLSRWILEKYWKGTPFWKTNFCSALSFRGFSVLLWAELFVTKKEKTKMVNSCAKRIWRKSKFWFIIKSNWKSTKNKRIDEYFRSWELVRCSLVSSFPHPFIPPRPDSASARPDTPPFPAGRRGNIGISVYGRIAIRPYRGQQITKERVNDLIPQSISIFDLPPSSHKPHSPNHRIWFPLGCHLTQHSVGKLLCL